MTAYQPHEPAWRRWLHPLRASLTPRALAERLPELLGCATKRSPALIAPTALLLGAVGVMFLGYQFLEPASTSGWFFGNSKEATDRGVEVRLLPDSRGRAVAQSRRRSGPPVKPREVPFISQWVAEEQSGKNNCLPAAAAMVIASYGGKVGLHDAVLTIRDGKNDARNSLLDFDESTWEVLLRRFDMVQEEVNDIVSLRDQLDEGHPVIMLVDNRQFMRSENGREVPYPPGRGFEGPHFVVVTRYDLNGAGEIEKLYINDSLAVKQAEGKRLVADPDTGTNFPVTIEAFLRAVTRAKPPWHGLAVFPK